MSNKIIPFEAVETRLTEIARAKAELDMRLSELSLEEEMLKRLASSAVDADDIERQPRKHAARPGSTTQKVMEFVAENPGMALSDVSDVLKDRIETDSANPRRLVYNTASNLVKRGQLLRDDDGGLYVAAAPEENGHAAHIDDT